MYSNTSKNNDVGMYRIWIEILLSSGKLYIVLKIRINGFYRTKYLQTISLVFTKRAINPGINHF